VEAIGKRGSALINRLGLPMVIPFAGVFLFDRSQRISGNVSEGRRVLP
jgi:hypothetical protein